MFFLAESGGYQRVVAFLKGISQDVLAKASLRSKAYTRALMHFEAYILESKEDIQDHLTLLQVGAPSAFYIWDVGPVSFNHDAHLC